VGIDVLEGIREGRLQRPDERTVAWTEWGRPNGVPLLRIPGTPGSRYALRADRTAWRDRDLRVITTERPGFGASTRLPGRGFAEHADDLAAVLDDAGIDAVHVEGGSGAAPHILAFVERYPDRVRAASIIVGIAPLNAAEIESMIPLNVEAHLMVRAGDIEGLRRRSTEVRGALLEDPIAGFRAIMETAPPADREIIGDPSWQQAFSVQMREALGQGIDGWVDEGIAIERPWIDIHPEEIQTSITWWHSDADRNCPISAARRLVDRLSNATLRVWKGAGHLEGYLRAPEILDELLSRPSRP
jgi:pimeloyl-ACP methyl ester carboxylesterase